MNDDEELRSDINVLSFDRLKVVSALGRGAKGVVFLVEAPPAAGDLSGADQLLALKVISKDLIESKKKLAKNNTAAKSGGSGSEYRRVSFEQRVLSRFRHPLLPRLRGVLDDRSGKLVGFAIDYCPGRDLNVLRKRQTERMFSDDVIRFYAAELVLAMEYLHGLGIVYRDLKPENVMVQENGHIMIVDFDLSTRLTPKTPVLSSSSRSSTSDSASDSASLSVLSRKRFSPFHYRCCNSGITPDDDSPELGGRAESDSFSEKSNSFVGTEEYVAPEIVSGDGHDFAVDWWSLGVVLYEMLYGATPFRGANRKETFYRILTKSPELVGEPTALRDLIRKLLEKDPRRRIGVDEIKGHDFFRGIDWESVVQISRPPYIPEVGTAPDHEGIEVIDNIDVEMVVRGIFGKSDNVVDHDHDHDNHDDRKKFDQNNHAGSVNTKVWVEGLNHHHPTQMDKFLVF